MTVIKKIDFTMTKFKLLFSMAEKHKSGIIKMRCVFCDDCKPSDYLADYLINCNKCLLGDWMIEHHNGETRCPCNENKNKNLYDHSLLALGINEAEIMVGHYRCSWSSTIKWLHWFIVVLMDMRKYHINGRC